MDTANNYMDLYTTETQANLFSNVILLLRIIGTGNRVLLDNIKKKKY